MFDRLTAVWHYRPPLDRVVQELKFGGLAFLARDLAKAMATHAGEELQAIDTIVPVPLHWRRQLARGYNQAAEIARSIGALADRPVRSALRRSRPTRPQSSLPRTQRSANTGGAFVARRRSIPSGARVGLIDDVMTTGATLESCATALKAVGAASVAAIVAARTPPPELGERSSGRDLEGNRLQLSAVPMAVEGSVIHVGQGDRSRIDTLR